MYIYRYDQNNSYGVFHPPVTKSQPENGMVWTKGNDVYVYAESPEMANLVAETHTSVYLDGSGDCPCCGNRWYSFYPEDQTDNYGIHDPSTMSDSDMNRHNVPFSIREEYANV